MTSQRRPRRRIPRQGFNFFLIDACFLANKFIPPECVTDPQEKLRIEASLGWWEEIDAQVAQARAIIYVPDVCIAEAFKVLAAKYYRSKYFPNARAYANARVRLSKFVRTPNVHLKNSARRIRVHDISTCRDIIIAVDRFFEVFFKKKLSVSVPDLLILATAKYLMDFYRVPRQQLHIVTADRALWLGSKHLADIPGAFNPEHTPAAHAFQGAAI